MKKKPYILPKNKAIEVSDPIGNFHRDEDERILGNLITESMTDDSETIARLMCGLDQIWMIALDYDGETTVNGLRGLIDELRNLSADVLHNKRKLPKNFKTWKEFAIAKGLL
jgi:hypothetical protein